MLQNLNSSGNAGSGIEISNTSDATASPVTINCGSAYYNSTTGLQVQGFSGGPAASLKLQGFRAYWNGTDENILTAAPVVRTTCP